MPHPPRAPLDERLIRVTLDLLAHEGLGAVSLRRIARRAGVSHGAPLRHFRGLAGLLAEVAAQGFQLLSEAVEKSGAQLPPGTPPLERLRAAGRAYVESAVAHRELFALMFQPNRLDWENPFLVRESAAAFEQLVRQVRAAQDAGWQQDRETRLLAGSVWATVHGLAALFAQGALAGPLPRASLDDVLDTTLELVLGDRQGETR
ncbi:MAG: TetR/AcrR family transcriptional regulator [Myxococcota bacterium]